MTTYDNTDLTVAGGDVIYAADLNDISARLPRTYIKSSPTSRNTTTTYANDTELVSIPLEVGTFEIELVGQFTLSTTATQKIKTQWAFTGTWNGSTAARVCFGPGSAQTGGPTAVTDMFVQALHVNGQDAVYDVAAGTGSYSSFRELAGQVTVTVAGTLSLQWAQNASSANNTTLQEGSYFRIRRMA